MVGRLKPGASVEQAQQQVDALNARNLDRFPNMKQILVNAGFHTVVRPLQEDLVSEVRPTLFLLWGGVLFVLAIGAVNITNLVLIRSTARMRELATRHALGAGLARLTRQLLTETVLLTLAGGGPVAALGYWGLALLSRLGLESLPRSDEIRMDGTVVGFTMRACAGGRRPRRARPGREPAAGQSEPGLPRGGPQRHHRPRRARHAPHARRQPGGLRVHAADRRRAAARELRASAGDPAGIRAPSTC